MKSMKRKRWLAVVAAVAVAGAGLEMLWDRGPEAHAAPSVAMPQVKYKTAQRSPVFDMQDYSGRLEAVDLVEVRPKVPGTLLTVHFKDGQRVLQNQLLFSIDPAPFAARVQQAQASLAGAQARQQHAQLEQQRARRLLDAQSISQREFDALDHAANESQATLKGAQAALVQAQLDLSYTQVRSPIAGRVSRAEITAGNVVGAGGDALPLTRIVSEKGLYAAFNVDEQSYLRLIAPSLRNGSPPLVKVGLAADPGFPHAARLEAIDNRMDTRSGTVRLRARVDAVSPEMLPGLQARVRLQAAAPYEAVVVDEAVIGTDQDRKYVLVVNADNKVERRFVEPGVLQGKRRVLRSGIEAGARVIVDGAYRAAPGIEVSAMDADAPVPNPAPAAAAPAATGTRS